MHKLLSANFSRLWKDKIFWLGTVFMFGYGIFAVCIKYSDIVRYNIHSCFDDALMIYVPFIGFLSAIFSSLFLGTEYSDGTIRNKIAVGHLRTSIYLSSWITSITAAILMASSFLLPYCILGLFLLEASVTPARQIILCILISIVTISAYISLFHMLSMLITKKSTSAVICLLFFIALLMLAMMINARLDAPEFLPSYGLSINGVEQLSTEPNPKYLQPVARKVYQFFFDLLPTGQSIQLSMFHVVHPVLMTLYSVVISAAATVFGIFAFKKKNLK